jgi:hypothetical protein
VLMYLIRQSILMAAQFKNRGNAWTAGSNPA